MRRFVSALVPEVLIVTGLLLGIASVSGKKPPDASGHREPRTKRRESAEPAECGPASLYILCKWSGRPHSLKELRQLASTSIVGTNMYQLKEAAAALGFKVQACNCSFENLWMHVSRPKCYAILHSPKLHYVPVVCAADDRRVRIVDSDLGVEDLANADLVSIFAWDGTALLLTDK